MVEVGDRVLVESEKVGSPTRGGVVVAVEERLAVLDRLGGRAFPTLPYPHKPGMAASLAKAFAELGVFFDTVVVCSVTGSTQAGMIAGFAAQETERAVLGIDGSATVAQTRDQIARIARFTAEAIGLGRDLDDYEIVLLDEWHAGTYGIPDERTIIVATGVIAVGCGSAKET